MDENKDVVIKPAERGGAVVIIDHNKCVNVVHRLKNSDYKELQTNPLFSMQLDFIALLNKAKDAGWITECESGFLK